MSGLSILLIGLFALLTYILGYVIGVADGKPKNEDIVGTITINLKDPSKDLFSLTFTKDLDKIVNSDTIVFEVKK